MSVWNKRSGDISSLCQYGIHVPETLAVYVSMEYTFRRLSLFLSLGNDFIIDYPKTLESSFWQFKAEFYPRCVSSTPNPCCTP